MKIFFCFLFISTAFSSYLHAETKDKEVYSTSMDFDSTMIDGKMKAPNGFLLQGRNRQSLSNMVKLRSNFSSKLRDSKAAVKAVVK